MGTLIILFITLLAVANGAWLTCLVVERAALRARVVVGAVVGLALLAWVGFLTALAFKLNVISIGITTAILVAGLIALLQKIPVKSFRARLNEARLDKIGLVYYSAWAVLLVWLFSRVVMFYPDGLHTAPANNFGDLPFHFGVITSFAYGENLPPQNPIFAGMKFTYPFLIDFLTAFFIRCGADWRAAFFVENIVLSLGLVGLIELMTWRITKIRLAALIAPVIFLFNGGIGFLNFFQQLSRFFNDPQQAKLGLVSFLAALPNAYTMNAELAIGGSKLPLRWGNVFTTLLIPQRSMLFGLPFVALIVLLWWMAVAETRGLGDGATVGEIFPSPPFPPRLVPPSQVFVRCGCIGRLAADAARAWILCGDDGQRGNGAAVLFDGLAGIFCSGRGAGRAAGVISGRHAGQK